jgi:hypothetical protein
VRLSQALAQILTAPSIDDVSLRCALCAAGVLCGRDASSGQNYEHRREWVAGRLGELAGIFAVEMTGYCVMRNHLHAVLRTRPDVARRGGRYFRGGAG